jgi:hypothetical protein
VARARAAEIKLTFMNKLLGRGECNQHLYGSEGGWGWGWVPGGGQVEGRFFISQVGPFVFGKQPHLFIDTKTRRGQIIAIPFLTFQKIKKRAGAIVIESNT